MSPDEDEMLHTPLPHSNPWARNGPPSQSTDSNIGSNLYAVRSNSTTSSRQPSWLPGSPQSMPNPRMTMLPQQFLANNDLELQDQWPVPHDQIIPAGSTPPFTNFDSLSSELMPVISHTGGSRVQSEPGNGDVNRFRSPAAWMNLSELSEKGATRPRSTKRRRIDPPDEQKPTTIKADFVRTPNLSHLQQGFIRPQSPFASHFLAEDFNRLQIKSGLLKVYHDSFEGALSCWLTERNCPYSISSFEDKNVWSRSWANRIFARTSALDETYAEAGILSPRDQKQASKVLNAVVMAFSAQWSRPERRKSRNGQADPFSAEQLFEEVESNGMDGHPGGAEKFGRNVQRTLWHKAKTALFEASENMSFKVIFAGIIFALTQRPVEGTELASKTECTDDKLSVLFELLDLDGPTLSLDAALRKLNDHRRHLRQAKHPRRGACKAPAQLSTEDQETFNLLYWLAVMFDTLSAAMNKRSFTIADEETHIGRDNLRALQRWSVGRPQDAEGFADDRDLWGSFFMLEQSHIGDLRKHSARWPCSYEDAAACLADAAPVKVLLYRRVGHLQSLFYQEASPEEIERGIEAVLEVYNHWTDTYNLFITDCLKHHETLPVRIQSWYTLLAAHWNLAVLIFTDLIENLGQAGMTMSCNSELRESMGLSSSIRQLAIVQISDLGFHARHTTEPTAFAQSADFHHAVNEAALLTEPWTLVLIRAFSSAGVVLANRVKLEGCKGEIGVEVCSESRRRLQWCIDALALLGRKSDMAMCAADVLRKAAS
ncbi:hypothetical protein Slin15195_G083090 [Septoria linicola]|uniref:Transcription factor domain-containing protein n=1 Tax=Septoria linicola TaxID=215465 RepID=A0A9Q9ELD7_9PEZI|nr:hypothetical protein Slin14017_G085600 [Septoria linicola]USW54990.1 hypothetical protein Slin15195_G083090 [Septoria linicola]